MSHVFVVCTCQSCTKISLYLHMGNVSVCVCLCLCGCGVACEYNINVYVYVWQQKVSSKILLRPSCMGKKQVWKSFPWIILSFAAQLCGFSTAFAVGTATVPSAAPCDCTDLYSTVPSARKLCGIVLHRIRLLQYCRSIFQQFRSLWCFYNSLAQTHAACCLTMCRPFASKSFTGSFFIIRFSIVALLYLHLESLCFFFAWSDTSEYMVPFKAYNLLYIVNLICFSACIWHQIIFISDAAYRIRHIFAVCNL